MVSGTCLRIVVFPSNLEHNRIFEIVNYNRIQFLQCVCMKCFQMMLLINLSGIITKSNKPHSQYTTLVYRVSIHQWAEQWYNFCMETALSTMKIQLSIPVQFKTLSCKTWVSHTSEYEDHSQLSYAMLCKFVYGYWYIRGNCCLHPYSMVVMQM